MVLFKEKAACHILICQGTACSKKIYAADNLGLTAAAHFSNKKNHIQEGLYFCMHACPGYDLPPRLKQFVLSFVKV